MIKEKQCLLNFSTLFPRNSVPRHGAPRTIVLILVGIIFFQFTLPVRSSVRVTGQIKAANLEDIIIQKKKTP
jgi:hypothetical protein